MILLEYHNKIIEDLLLEKFAPPAEGKYESVEATIADFDGVTFHIASDATSKNILYISMSMKCWSDLEAFGVDDVMKQKYGAYLTSPEGNYNVTLRVDLSAPGGEPAKVAHEIALIKRHALASAFYKVFADIEGKKGAQPVVEIKYRDDEAIYIKPESDRAIVIFNISFKDADDVIFAKVFLQAYADERKTMTNVPAVTYSQKEPPLELKGVRNIRVGDNNGFVSFVLFQPHIQGNKKEKTIDNIETFRNYLHYHIKCSKAHLHTRMRTRVRSFLQVLNRAKSEIQSAEKKTISGRTFRRADEGPSKNEDDIMV